MFEMNVQETVLTGGKLYDVDIVISVKEKYPWIMKIEINGKQFELKMNGFPLNVEQAAVVFEVLSDPAERRQYCEFTVNNLFVVMSAGRRVRAVDFYGL